MAVSVARDDLALAAVISLCIKRRRARLAAQPAPASPDIQRTATAARNGSTGMQTIKRTAEPAHRALAARLAWQVWRLDIDDPDVCLRLFRANRDAGLILLAGLILDAAVRG